MMNTEDTSITAISETTLRMMSALDSFAVYLRSMVDADTIAPTTASAYTYGLNLWRDYLRRNQPGRIDESTVLAWMGWVKAERNVSSKSIALWLSALRRFFRWAVANRLAGNDPTANVRAQRSASTRHKKDALPDSDVRALLSVELSARDACILALKTYCGLRDVEVQRIDVEHFGERLNPVTQTYRRVLFIRGKGKTDEDDFVIIEHPAVAAALSSWMAERGEQGGALFTSESIRNRGERLSVRSIKRIVIDAMRAAGVKRSKRITSHSLRHTAITKVAHVSGLRAAQVFARHAKLETTAGYVHDDFRIADPAELAIDFGGAGSGVKTAINESPSW